MSAGGSVIHGVYSQWNGSSYDRIAYFDDDNYNGTDDYAGSEKTIYDINTSTPVGTATVLLENAGHPP